MPRLRPAVSSLQDLTVHYIAVNIQEFWKSHWDHDLKFVTGSFYDVLIPLRKWSSVCKATLHTTRCITVVLVNLLI